MLTVAFFLTFIFSYLHVKGSGAAVFYSFAFSFAAAAFAFYEDAAYSYYPFLPFFTFKFFS